MDASPLSEDLAGELRRCVFPLAYRMVGTVAEAEDLVQEALLRYQAALGKGVSVANPHGFLVTTTTRLAIDHLRSARLAREIYPGEWLPEPVVDQKGKTTADTLEMAESLSLAFLVLLETLSPLERAVFLLRQVFDYEYAEIASITGRSETNCRQAFSRARKQISSKRPRYEASAEKRDALARQFFATCKDGSLAELEALLAADIAFHGDGGGVALAVLQPVLGSASVARLLRGIFQKAAQYNVSFSEVSVNGHPGLLARDAEGALVSVMSLHVVDGKIAAVHSIINPEKLRHLGKVSEMARLKR